MAKIKLNMPVLNMPQKEGKTHLAWIHARSQVQEGCMVLCKGNIFVWCGSVDSPVEDVDFDNVYLSWADHAVVVENGRAKARKANS
jgi:hypothetical protein